MKRICVMAVVLAGGASHADDIEGIQNHKVQKQFMQEPCTTVIDVIDNASNGVGEMAMAFGFLMGFEATHPNIRGDQETILTRLRIDCAAKPDQTAMALLQSYSENDGEADSVASNQAAAQAFSGYSYDATAVKTNCEGMFPNDFSTQKFCISQGELGFDEFIQVIQNAPEGAQGAVKQCASMFPNDWGTAAFCARDQVSAFNGLQ